MVWIVLKLLAGLVVVVICLAWYPLWELGLLLMGGLLFLSWQEESSRRHQEIHARLTALEKAQTTPPPPPPSPSLPRVGFTSYEEYVTYRQAHGLPYTSAPSMWSDGS